MHPFLAIQFFLLHQVVIWWNEVVSIQKAANNKRVVSTCSGEIKVWLWPRELFKDARWRQRLTVPVVLEAIGGIPVQEQIVPCLHVGQ